MKKHLKLLLIPALWFGLFKFVEFVDNYSKNISTGTDLVTGMEIFLFISIAFGIVAFIASTIYIIADM